MVLDEFQRKVIYDDSKSLLVIAGAGSGKTSTIIEKIKYLINYKNVRENEILCISFTNEAVNNIKYKLSNNVDCFTFHKLALEILDSNRVEYSICNADYLEYIVDEFFISIIYEYPIIIKLVLEYFRINYLFKDINKVYLKVLNTKYKDIDSLKKVICTFIHLFKTNNYKLCDFISFNKKLFFKRNKILLKLILNIYLYYTNELNSSFKIDFDDMIINARNVILNNGYIKNYKYIIIDEYQDISYIRYLLIKSIVDRNNSNIICVGDDYQSIYRFSGCDIDLFINFSKYFDNASVIKLENTYRNSNEITKVANKFIMKNKLQINKSINSNKYISDSIVICFCSLKEIIDEIYNHGQIMILGRNNYDINKYLDNELVLVGDTIKYKNINIKYLTIHKSKGLESDNVIVLNNINDNNGFPNKIKNDSIIKLVSLNKNKCLYDEERRLFYVALTRTKNRVYLMTEKYNKSIFINELIREHKKYIKIRRHKSSYS